MVHRADTRTWEAVEDKNNDRILLQSSSELPADLKQDQQEFNEKNAINNVVRSLNLWIRRLFEEKSFENKYFSSYEKTLIVGK
jgi:hypothetical protein